MFFPKVCLSGTPNVLGKQKAVEVLVLTYAEETRSHHREHLLAQLKGVVNLDQLSYEQYHWDSAEEERGHLSHKRQGTTPLV